MEGAPLIVQSELVVAAAPEVIVTDDIAAPGPATGEAPPAPPAAPAWHPHDIDMDMIQRKLTRHKYYTPAEVLADIALIEENARHTSDPDRQLKVSEMAAHARMHVQSFDPKWTPEFENLAMRMRARKAERAAAKAASQAATRRGSSASDIVAPAGADAGAATDTAANGKRDREDDDENAERAKRAREDGDGMDVDAIHNGANSSGAASVPTQPTESQFTELSTQPESVPVPSAAEAREPTPKARTRTPTPEPEYPPLVVPEEELESLSRALKHSTGQLNVEQLEQLRASLLDRVWRARKDWDRTALIVAMRESISRFVAEAADARRAQEEYV